MNGQVIRSHRLSKSQSVEAAAKAIGISKAQLSRLENGVQEAQPDVVRALFDWSEGEITPNKLFDLPPAPVGNSVDNSGGQP